MSDFKPTDISVIVVGNWNTKIFHPVWIFDNLLKDSDSIKKSDEIGVLVDIINKEVGYSIKGVEFLPKSKLLEIKVTKDFADDKIILLSALLNNTLISLPHTPVNGIGINFNYFFESGENIDLLKWFNNLTQNIYLDFMFGDTRISKKLNDSYLNIVFSTQKDKKIKVSFNFHYNKIIDFKSAIFLDNLKIVEGYLK